MPLLATIVSFMDHVLPVPVAAVPTMSGAAARLSSPAARAS